MTVTVNTDTAQLIVANGVDFVVDWESGAPEPGLSILDKDESDNSATQVAYFAPGCWKAVVKTP